MPTFVNDGGSGVPSFVTKWGQHGEGDGEFRDPTGVAVDSSGYVYVAEVENDRIQKFDFEGTFMAEWGSHGEGDGQFIAPLGVDVDSSNNVYVTDQGNTRIQKFR
jgi:tripartite motif-containing protein 71